MGRRASLPSIKTKYPASQANRKMDNVIIVPSKIEGETFGKVGDRQLKIRLVNPDAPSERLWSQRIIGDQYQITNIPAFSTEYCFGDIVSVKDVQDEMPEITGKLVESGHLPV